MLKVFASIVCVASVACATAAERSVVLGKANTIEYANVDTPCPADSICLDGWFRYRLTIEKVLKGPAVPRSIRAVHMQHTNFIPAFRKSLRLFVLRPVEGKEARATLKADFYLDDMSPAHELYCLRGAPDVVGLKSEGVTVASEDRFCFSADEATR